MYGFKIKSPLLTQMLRKVKICGFNQDTEGSDFLTHRRHLSVNKTSTAPATSSPALRPVPSKTNAPRS